MKIAAFVKSTISSFIIFSLVLFSTGNVFSAPGSGAIWTTTGSCGSPQNSNHYHVGDSIFINGSGFDAGTYNWQIEGQPGQASGDPHIVVASGSQVIGANGAFCFSAYIVLPGDWGEYTVDFGQKNDNYQVDVDVATATPTVTPTSTPTNTPTPSPTATPTPSATPYCYSCGNTNS